MDPATAVAVARLELALDENRRRLDELEAIADRVLAEQRAHRARMAAALEAIGRRTSTNGHR